MIWSILGALFLVIGFTFISAITDEKYLAHLFLSYLLVIIGTRLIIGFNKPEPRAIDVYRGKTTLEITYKDGVPIDSTVVFKDK